MTKEEWQQRGPCFADTIRITQLVPVSGGYKISFAGIPESQVAAFVALCEVYDESSGVAVQHMYPVLMRKSRLVLCLVQKNRAVLVGEGINDE